VNQPVRPWAPKCRGGPSKRPGVVVRPPVRPYWAISARRPARAAATCHSERHRPPPPRDPFSTPAPFFGKGTLIHARPPKKVHPPTGVNQPVRPWAPKCRGGPSKRPGVVVRPPVRPYWAISVARRAAPRPPYSDRTTADPPPRDPFSTPAPFFGKGTLIHARPPKKVHPPTGVNQPVRPWAPKCRGGPSKRPGVVVRPPVRPYWAISASQYARAAATAPKPPQQPPPPRDPFSTPAPFFGKGTLIHARPPKKVHPPTGVNNPVSPWAPKCRGGPSKRPGVVVRPPVRPYWAISAPPRA
jgi:hypothetical protein